MAVPVGVALGVVVVAVGDPPGGVGVVSVAVGVLVGTEDWIQGLLYPPPLGPPSPQP